MREKVDRDEADCRVQRPTNVSAYVFISEVVAQQMGTESTSWNEGKEAGKDREKIERGGEGLVQVCL